MKALFIQNKSLDLISCTKPLPEKHESLIRVLACGICDTDLQLIQGYKNFSGIPGHEFVGIVEESNEPHLIAKRVVGEINIPCEKCDFCCQNITTHCRNRRTLGIINHNGAHAEYIVLNNKNLHIIPDTITTLNAIFIEPLAAAYQILEQVNIDSQTKVLIIGDGKLGLLISHVLLETNCKLTILGRHKNKLGLLQNLNIAALIDSENLIPKTMDIVVECTGNSEGLILAKNFVKPRGKIILKSTYAKNISIDLSDIVVNENQIIGSRCGSFLPAINLLQQKKYNFSFLVDQIYPLKDSLKAYEHAQRRGALKIIIANGEI